MVFFDSSLESPLAAALNVSIHKLVKFPRSKFVKKVLKLVEWPPSLDHKNLKVEHWTKADCREYLRSASTIRVVRTTPEQVWHLMIPFIVLSFALCGRGRFTRNQYSLSQLRLYLQMKFRKKKMMLAVWRMMSLSLMPQCLFWPILLHQVLLCLTMPHVPTPYCLFLL